VYSFGVVMWEVYTRAVPYDDIDLPESPIAFVEAVKDGLRPTVRGGG
jgi:hypothetical protein